MVLARIFRATFPFLNFFPHIIWCIDCAVWLLPLRSSCQNTSICFLVFITFQLNATCFPSILLVYILVLLVIPSSVLSGIGFIFFARLLAPYTFLVGLFVCFKRTYHKGTVS